MDATPVVGSLTIRIPFLCLDPVVYCDSQWFTGNLPRLSYAFQTSSGRKLTTDYPAVCHMMSSQKPLRTKAKIWVETQDIHIDNRAKHCKSIKPIRDNFQPFPWMDSGEPLLFSRSFHFFEDKRLLILLVTFCRHGKSLTVLKSRL